MRDEDLPAVQHLRQRDAAVMLPFLQNIEVVDEDNEVLRATLVEDLGYRFVGARHSVR